jgi:hypothetical protein
MRIIFEDQLSVRKALMFVRVPSLVSLNYKLTLQDHHQLSYHVGDSLRRLWVKRATYTSEEWVCPFHPPRAVADAQAIIPEHRMVSTKDEANHSTSPLIDYCRHHTTLQHLFDEPNLAVSSLPSFIDLNDLPRQYWPSTSPIRMPHSISRKPLKSQNDEFHAAGYKTARA